jgi:hypothetical protein
MHAEDSESMSLLLGYQAKKGASLRAQLALSSPHCGPLACRHGSRANTARISGSPKKLRAGLKLCAEPCMREMGDA